MSDHKKPDAKQMQQALLQSQSIIGELENVTSLLRTRCANLAAERDQALRERDQARDSMVDLLKETEDMKNKLAQLEKTAAWGDRSDG